MEPLILVPLGPESSALARRAASDLPYGRTHLHRLKARNFGVPCTINQEVQPLFASTRGRTRPCVPRVSIAKKSHAPNGQPPESSHLVAVGFRTVSRLSFPARPKPLQAAATRLMTALPKPSSDAAPAPGFDSAVVQSRPDRLEMDHATSRANKRFQRTWIEISQNHTRAHLFTLTISRFIISNLLPPPGKCRALNSAA